MLVGGARKRRSFSPRRQKAPARPPMSATDQLIGRRRPLLVGGIRFPSRRTRFKQGERPALTMVLASVPPRWLPCGSPVALTGWKSCSGVAGSGLIHRHVVWPPSRRAEIFLRVIGRECMGGGRPRWASGFLPSGEKAAEEKPVWPVTAFHSVLVGGGDAFGGPGEATAKWTRGGTTEVRRGLLEGSRGVCVGREWQRGLRGWVRGLGGSVVGGSKGGRSVSEGRVSLNEESGAVERGKEKRGL